MAKKAVIAGISTVLLIAIAIGVIASTSLSRSHSPSSSPLSTSSKSISSFCAPTLYPDICHRTLLSSSINQSSSPGDIIRAALKFIASELQSASQFSQNLHPRANSSIDKDGFLFCNDLLADARDQLSAVLAEADNANRRLDDLQAWLSMIISYRTNCLASIEAEDLNELMSNALRNATELTDNALAILSVVEGFFEKFEVGVNKSREIFRVSGKSLVYPSWVGAGERKMLGSRVVRPRFRPNAVVAKDGSGGFGSINDALDAMPKSYRGRYVIYVKAGIYNEKVIVGKDKPNLLIYGDGPRKTIVTGRLCNAEGVGTYKTASFSVLAPGFIAQAMGFTNTAGPEGHQAVALRLSADAAVIYNCRIDGFQDSFYSQSGRHFVRNTVISGTVDFIFGDSQVVIQNSLIILRHPMNNQENTVTAHGKATPHEHTGIVIQNSRIVPDLRLFPDRFKIACYLGRPWKQYSTTIIMESTIGDVIRAQGWLAWSGDFALDTLYYAEYNNRGPGARTDGRVTWKGYRVIGRREAMRWTASLFLAGRTWIPFSGVPNSLTLMRP